MYVLLSLSRTFVIKGFISACALQGCLIWTTVQRFSRWSLKQVCSAHLNAQLAKWNVYEANRLGLSIVENRVCSAHILHRTFGEVHCAELAREVLRKRGLVGFPTKLLWTRARKGKKVLKM